MKSRHSLAKEERKTQVNCFFTLGSVEYRVLWKGYPKDQSTWEPE